MSARLRVEVYPDSAGVARRVADLVVATGMAKAEAVAAAVEGPVSAHCPASIVQVHADAVVAVDPLAAHLFSGASGHGDRGVGRG